MDSGQRNSMINLRLTMKQYLTSLSPLKGFLEATRFKKVDPRKQVVFDIFDL